MKKRMLLPALKISGRQKRGETDPEEVKQFSGMCLPETRLMLQENDPQKRTIAALLLGNTRGSLTVPWLCEALEKESKLYCRIAITEALSKLGEPAVKSLTGLLGRIGSNQERILPDRPSMKKSFPLPRDIAARTLVQIGIPALHELCLVVKEKVFPAVYEAVDALGAIAAKTGSLEALPVLVEALELLPKDLLLKWKIIRALSGFHCPESASVLRFVLKTEKEGILLEEVKRSLKITGY